MRQKSARRPSLSFRSDHFTETALFPAHLVYLSASLDCLVFTRIFWICRIPVIPVIRGAPLFWRKNNIFILFITLCQRIISSTPSTWLINSAK